MKNKIMKKIFTFLLCLFLSVSAFSQEYQEENFSPYQISLGFPLSTLKLDDGEKYTVSFSVNVLVGTAKNIKGMAVAGVNNVIFNDAYGFHVAGIANQIYNNAYGMSVAGLANISESYYGIQVAGLANGGRDSFCGMQISGGLNVAGSAIGLAISGVNNMFFDALDGAQVTGVVNYAKKVRGAQIAGVTNISKNVKGLQFAGVMNMTKIVKGVQFAGVTNVAKNVKGLQFAGVTNIAKKVKGVQFATLLNIAEECDFPIALVNIIKNGNMGVALSYDLLNNAMLSFRSGGKYTYGILGVGYNHKVNDGSKIVAEAGYGIHVPVIDMLEINNEFKATSVGFSDDKVCFNFSYLLAPSFTYLNHYNIFCGVSFNYLNTNYVNSNDLMPNNYFWSKDGNYNQRMYIGYQIGLQYIF